jgi:hypothetical protein
MVKSRKPVKKSKSRKHIGYTIKKNRIVKIYCKKSRKTGKLSKSCPKKQRIFSNNKSASRSRLYKKKSTVKKVLKSKRPSKKSKSKPKKNKRKIVKKMKFHEDLTNVFKIGDEIVYERNKNKFHATITGSEVMDMFGSKSYFFDIEHKNGDTEDVQIKKSGSSYEVLLPNDFGPDYVAKLIQHKSQ